MILGMRRSRWRRSRKGKGQEEGRRVRWITMRRRRRIRSRIRRKRSMMLRRRSRVWCYPRIWCWVTWSAVDCASDGKRLICTSRQICHGMKNPLSLNKSRPAPFLAPNSHSVCSLMGQADPLCIGIGRPFSLAREDNRLDWYFKWKQTGWHLQQFRFSCLSIKKNSWKQERSLPSEAEVLLTSAGTADWAVLNAFARTL